MNPFNLLELSLTPQYTNKKRDRTIVRVTTSMWCSGNGVHQKRSLTTLKRKSIGQNLLEAECDAVGCGEDVISSIVNFNQVEDGVYELCISGESRDWETGYVDYWEYTLHPYKDKTMISYQECVHGTIVKLENKAVGMIKAVDGGYQYFPNRSRDGGDVMATIDQVKKSLESDNEE